jgi:hypothetical protein
MEILLIVLAIVISVFTVVISALTGVLIYQIRVNSKWIREVIQEHKNVTM